MRELKPIDFESKNVFKALLTSITIMIIAIMIAAFIGVPMVDKFPSYVISYTLVTIIIFIFRRNELITYLKKVPQDFKKNKYQIIIYTFIFLALEFFLNLIISKLTGTNVQNNVNVMDAANKTNIFLFIYFIAIITPLYEGLVFTYPYQKIKNKKLAYIFISVVFALLHLTASNSLIELLYFIPYLSLGLALNYSFYKTNNVFMSIIVHAINDLLVYVILLII